MALCLPVCLSVSVTSQCSIDAGILITLVFGMGASIHPSEEIPVPLKIRVLPSRSLLQTPVRKFCYGILIVEMWTTRLRA